MMLAWEDFKLVLGQNSELQFEYNQIGNMYHISLYVNSNVFYECLLKKYLEPSADQIDFETNWLI